MSHIPKTVGIPERNHDGIGSLYVILRKRSQGARSGRANSSRAISKRLREAFEEEDARNSKGNSLDNAAN